MKLRLVSAGLLVAGLVSGCSTFEIHEEICSEGEQPVWAFSSRIGSQCVRDGKVPPPGFVRFPRGRVPVWINPPADYPERTPDGHDRYHLNPNDSDYPWWDEVIAEHPELACDDSARRFAEVPLKPGAGQGAQVTVLVNSVENRCFRFDWPSSLGKVLSADLSVREQGWPKPWSRAAADDASARELLRVASDKCLKVTATLRLEQSDGTLLTFRADRVPVPGTCSS